MQNLDICKCGHFNAKHDRYGCAVCDCLIYINRINEKEPQNG